MGNVGIEARNWFGTVVMQHDLEPNFAKTVDEKVCVWLSTSANDTLTVAENEVVKTTYYTHSTFLEVADLVDLKNVFMSVCQKYLSEMGVSMPPEARLQSWLNVYETGDASQYHEHYGSVLSGCYYVNSPPDGARFIVRDPVSERQLWLSQIKANQELPLCYHSIFYKPIPGRLIIFPPWLTHGVEAHKNEQPRVSIAFNLTY